jgi:hypothetical protein
VKIEYDKATKEITVRLAAGDEELAAARLSESGASRMVATTRGFVPIDGAPDDLKIGINLIRVIPKAERRKA